MKKKMLMLIISILFLLLVTVTALYVVKIRQDIPSNIKQSEENVHREQPEIMSSSSQTDINADKKLSGPLSIDDIKKKYIDRNIKNITYYNENYAVIESTDITYPSYPSRFDFYNLKTGDMDELPTKPYYAGLYKISDANHIIFESTGRDNIQNCAKFPFYIECIRNEEHLNYMSDFFRIEKAKYLSIHEAAVFGPIMHSQTSLGLKVSSIIDFKETTDGVEILIGPAKGSELIFVTDKPTIPPTKTYISRDQSQFIIELQNTVADRINVKNINLENNFIKSVSIKDNDDNAYIILNLKDTVKYYTGGTRDIKIKYDNDVGLDFLPCLDISFAEYYE